MNDKPELIAIVLALEAMQGQANLFPNGVQMIIDNQFVCFACQALASGINLCPSTAHYPTFRRLQRVIRDKRISSHSAGFLVILRKVTGMMKSCSRRMIGILMKALMLLPPEARL